MLRFATQQNTVLHVLLRHPHRAKRVHWSCCKLWYGDGAGMCGSAGATQAGTPEMSVAGVACAPGNK